MVAAELVATTSLTDPVEALRDALATILDGLFAAGCGPQHLLSMTWEAGEPAAFHLSRHEVELAYREVFAGFRPPIRLQPRAEPGLAIRARHSAPTPPPERLVQGYTLPQLARQYSPRLQADMKALFRQWSRDGEAFRAHHRSRDLAYGPGRFETLDLYLPPGVSRPPLWVFIHGGYWQASDKVQHAQFARGMLAAGFSVAMPNYGLAPETPLEQSTAQIVAALNFLVGEAEALGIDAGRLHLAGHSAGAHLAAMALVASDAPPIASGLLLSGLFDLEPLGHLPLGRLLGLDDLARARRLSLPGRLRPSARLAFAVGEAESDAFKAQSTALATAWRAEPPVLCAGHHFSLLDGLHGGKLLELARSIAAA